MVATNSVSVIGKTINGTLGDDALVGSPDSDTLNGLAGNDTIDGGAGDDTLIGGAGNDILTGGAGNDKFQFSKGDGQDVLTQDFDVTPGKINTLIFNPGITTSDVVAQRSNNDLILNIANTTDSFTVSDFFYNDDPFYFYNPLQQITFLDGSVTWLLSTIAAKAFLGSINDDTTYGTINGDSIFGGAGLDTLFGNGGDDSIFGDAGDDVLYGGDGNDILDGGTGNDSLTGNLGDDLFLFGKGDGQDTLNIESNKSPGEVNTLKFKPGISELDVIAQRSNDDLLLQIANTSDSFTITDFFYTDSPDNYRNPLQQITFADNPTITWDLSRISAQAFLGSTNDDISNGTISDDKIYGGDGADNLYGNDGNDSLFGGNGNDSLDGGNGDDTLDGGLGNDTLNGGLGNNTYLFGVGDGKDVLNYQLDNTVNKKNILTFKDGITPSAVDVQRSGANLVLTISGTSDSFTVNNFFYNNDPLNAYNPLQQINFTNSTVTWDLNTITSHAFLGSAGDDLTYGTINNDIIYGGFGVDKLYGEDGDDYLTGDAGADLLDGGNGQDTLDGGSGNDILQGGQGNDIYLFGRNDGQDILLSENDPAVNKNNLLQFKTGVVASDVSLIHSGDDLLLSIINTTDSFKVTSFFAGNDPNSPANPLQQIKFSDGKIWDLNTIINNTTTNHVPILANPISNQTVIANTVFTFRIPDNSFIDPDPNESLIYSATSADNTALPSWLSFDSSTHTFIGAPNSTDLGNIDVKIAVTDKSNTSISDTFMLAITAVVPTNSAPILSNAIADILVYEDAPINYQLPFNSFSDTDTGDTLTFSANLTNGSALPSWLSFDANSLTFSGLPNNNAIGSLPIQVTATDKNNISVSDTFVITVLHINHAPTGSNTSVNTAQDSTYTFNRNDFNFTDQDRSDQLQNIQIAGLPAKGSLTLTGKPVSVGQSISLSNIIAGLLTFSPSSHANGNNYSQFTFKLSDGTDLSLLTYQININVSSVNNEITGTVNNDRITGKDYVNDTLQGKAGNDRLTGLGGNDSLYGGEGKDTLDGGNDDDLLDGGPGIDIMIGGNGNDTYIVDNPKDVVKEAANAGTDEIQTAVNFRLPKQVENLLLIEGSSAKNGSGNALPNSITGNQHANKLEGDAGNDLIFGGAGNDTLLGGPGDDGLYGGIGNDILDGGTGNDVFYFSPGAGQDLIKNFGDKGGHQDKMDLTDFNTSYEHLHIVDKDHSSSIITIDTINASDFQITLSGIKAVNVGADDFVF